ncbi:DUF3987 domain-containing protein [Streptoverticillium reticulum]|uniref:DUF3987 domain-containing protein n=1 Tax=Streptoverticillium reticulum TaxID=1433415 RepID=UPI0039BFF008
MNLSEDGGQIPGPQAFDGLPNLKPAPDSYIPPIGRGRAPRKAKGGLSLYSGIGAAGKQRPFRPGPVPEDPVFTGPLGRMALDMSRDSEADPVGTLAHLIAALGCALGRGPHVLIGNQEHRGIIHVLIAGATADGRKGTCASDALTLVRRALPTFAQNNITSGLSSGEGLIESIADVTTEQVEEVREKWMKAKSKSEEASKDTVRDQWDFAAQDLENQLKTLEAAVQAASQGRWEDNAWASAGGKVDPSDKRRLLRESEWGVTMRRAHRQGSSLSGVLRQCWDGSDLALLNRSARKASFPHVAVIGDITPKEFRDLVSNSDVSGGTYNRFLTIYVHRNDEIALPRPVDPALLDEHGRRLRDIYDHGRFLDELGMTPEARSEWKDLIYPACNGSGSNTSLDDFVTRTAPYCMRLAMLYAIADHADAIHVVHLKAAHALVRYARASAAVLIGAASSGDARLDKVMGALMNAGTAGMSRKEITVKVFKGHCSGGVLDDVLERLLQQPGFGMVKQPGRGRPTQHYFYDADAAQAFEAAEDDGGGL